MSAMFLTAEEVRELTKRDRPGAQGRVLRALGVPFKAHPTDGILLVSRTAVESVFGLPAANQATPPDEAPVTYAVNVVALRAYGKKAQARRP